MSIAGHVLSPPPLTPPDQNPRRQHQRAAQHHLKRRAQERRFHVAVLDEGDRPQFDEHHDAGDGGRGPEMRNEIGQRVAEPADRGHDAGRKAALERRAAA